MKTFPSLIALFSLAASLLAADGTFEPHVFTGGNGGTLPYQLLKPTGSRSGKLPLVLFLHGAGERGTDNTAQLKNGTKLYLDHDNQLKFPSYVVAPQCPPNKQWVDMPWGADKGTQPEKPSESMQLVIALLDSLEKELPIDTDRVYVTGLSMGGYGTWDLVTRFPNRFAAGAPVCGGGDEAVAGKAAKVPLWVFHSDDDTTVKTIRSRNMVAALRAAGGQPKYFEYWGLGHNSWDAAYAEPELLPWMFSQKRGAADLFVVKATVPPMPAIAKIPDTDDGIPGAGPIRRYDWFKSLWRQKRIAWSKRLEQDKGAVVFLGDSITQGWGDNMGNSFPGMKVANRGISGDTTRGVILRLKEDVLDLRPKGVVLLIGTNDIEEGADAETIAGNVKLILVALKKSNPAMPIVVASVMPSDPSKKRPREIITRLNMLVDDLIKSDSSFIRCDAWSIFADEAGNAKKAEFPDLLHPNKAGYTRYAEALTPLLKQTKLLP